jgi:hypothetical protein
MYCGIVFIDKAQTQIAVEYKQNKTSFFVPSFTLRALPRKLSLSWRKHIDSNTA